MNTHMSRQEVSALVEQAAFDTFTLGVVKHLPSKFLEDPELRASKDCNRYWAALSILDGLRKLAGEMVLAEKFGVDLLDTAGTRAIASLSEYPEPFQRTADVLRDAWRDSMTAARRALGDATKSND